MNKLLSRRMIAWALTLCLLVGTTAVAGASATAQPSDFDALKPIMDLVASAAYSASDEPLVIGNEETSLTPGFISAFFNNGLTADASLGISADILASTDQQTAYLTKVFAAKLPEMQALTQTTPISGYIGFQPVTVNSDNQSDVQIIGELYWGAKPMSQMSEKGIIHFQPRSMNWS